MRNVFNQKRVFVKSLSVWSAFAVVVTTSAPAFAAGTAVLGGSAELTGHTRASLNAGTATDSYAQFIAEAGAASAVLDWSKFNVGTGKEMNFSGAGTTFFNLVDGALGRSEIDGVISGNGNVWVINPAGIAFGAGSSVNVGGLFAAAAGNLANADALRDGMATLPSFSSFEGSVDASKGAFTANQVALMGKTVSAGGDFSNVGNLTISATGGAMDVDEVQGGKVSVNIRDFTADGSEVTLGDLHIDGDLTVRATGRIMAGAKTSETSETKPVSLAATKTGEIVQAGKIDMLAYDDLIVDGELNSSGGGVLLQSYGCIDVQKNVTARGNVEIGALNSVWTRGNVKSTEGTVAVYSMYADTEINGDVSAADVVQINSAYFGGDGDLTINGNVVGKRVFVGAGVDFNEIGTDETGRAIVDANGNGGAGNVVVNGSVTAESLLMLDSFGGDVIISKDAVAKTTGIAAELDIAAGVGYMDWETFGYVPDEGNANIDGSVISENDGSIFVASGYGYGSKGNVSVGLDGLIDAGGDLYVYGGYGLGYGGVGRIMLQGDVTSGKDMLISSAGLLSSSSQFTGVTATGGVYARDGNLSVNGGLGNVILMGDVSAKKADFVADDYADYGYSGNVQILNIGHKLEVGEVTASGKGVTISGSAGDGVLTIGDVTATDEIRVYLTDGSLTVKEGATVRTSGSRLRMGTGLATDGTEGGSGNVTVNGALAASDLVQLHVAGRAVIGEKGSAKTTSDNGEVMVVASDGGALEINGELSADKVVYAVADGDVKIGKTGKVSSGGDNGSVVVWASEGAGMRGNVNVGGEVRGSMQSVVVSQNGSVNVESGGRVIATGQGGIAYVSSRGKNANVVVCGSVNSESDGGVVSVHAATDVGNSGNVEIADSGRIAAGATVEVVAGAESGSVSVSGTVSAGKEAYIATVDGDIAINGNVKGGEQAMIIAGVNGGAGGNISFGHSGRVSASSFVDLSTTGGDLMQSGGNVAETSEGFVGESDIPAAVSSTEVNLKIRGNIGSGTSGYVAVDGSIFGLVSGNAALAAADGKAFVGGSKPVHAPSFTATAVELMSSGSGSDQTFSTHVSKTLADAVNWDNASDNSSIVADGDLVIYTAGALNPYGLLVADRDLTVSAASFGDMSYLRAGGKLTVNNVGKPTHPQIAYFESVDGKEPKINNQPNDMVIFVDGRLAGGNLNILNKFGADEAFMVETPELKSTQGIFGNPPFLHSDLDVANPMEVSAIDYLIQEIPRLTLSSDFPAEVDQTIEASGLGQKDSYWFGQKDADDKKGSGEPAENSADAEPDSEKPAGKTVAWMR